MVRELQIQGVKISPDEVLAMSRLPNGKIVFLEAGNSSSGMQHILDKTESAFKGIGVSRDEIPKVLIDAINGGKIVGYQSAGTGRPIYEK